MYNMHVKKPLNYETQIFIFEIHKTYLFRIRFLLSISRTNKHA